MYLTVAKKLNLIKYSQFKKKETNQVPLNEVLITFLLTVDIKSRKHQYDW